MNVLYVTNSYAYKPNYVIDYDRAFGLYSKNNIYYFDVGKSLLDFDLNCFDVIILSYAFLHYCNEFPVNFKKLLSNTKAIKIPILQDEYNYFIKQENDLYDIGINAIITVVPQKYWTKVFGKLFSNIPKLNVLTGYVPEYMENQYNLKKPLHLRKWHIGYRSRTCKPIYGKLAHEKYDIGLNVDKICKAKGVPANIDVKEESRIYGKAWPEFIRNCRVMLGTESGSNVFDFTGEIATKIAQYQENHPNSTFLEIHKNCIGNNDGIIKMNQISPRIFEAVSLGTGHILFEGKYSGILKPWEHYIPLRKDYSNIDEVLGALDDLDFLEKMIARSYRDIVASGKYSFRNFVARVDKFLDSIPIRNKVAIGIDPYCKIEKTIPQRLRDLDIETLQREAQKHTIHLGQKYAGKNIMIYGAGEAYKKYIKFFTKSKILGIILDDMFLSKNPCPMPEAPYISFEQASQNAKNADAIVIFCRPQFKFEMREKVIDMANILEIQCCVLY